jgi:hypothetical protein|nr:MAG TPA: hypothetical protein [Caudoviricetes sp.]
MRALKDGVRSIIRDRIIQSCNYFQTLHCITTQQMENITKLYESYHNLSGNGVITSIYKSTMKLPIVTYEEFLIRDKMRECEVKK